MVRVLSQCGGWIPRGSMPRGGGGLEEGAGLGEGGMWEGEKKRHQRRGEKEEERQTRQSETERQRERKHTLGTSYSEAKFQQSAREGKIDSTS